MASISAIPAFTPLQLTLSEIRASIPPHLFRRDTSRGLFYLCRDLSMAVILMGVISLIDPLFARARAEQLVGEVILQCLRWCFWMLYWWYQGLVFTGIWVIGHECGHGAFSESQVACDFIGFCTHTALWTPYFSWKISHHRHHSTHASMEHDEVYVPKTRSRLRIPQAPSHEIDWSEYFADTPVYTLGMLVAQQLLGFPAYLFCNVSGQSSYPKWTNHFNPNSILFRKNQRGAVLLSNIGLLLMACATYCLCRTWGHIAIIKYYGVPWLFVNHWFIMITYLHHTDANLPHYRQPEWNYQRGAAATIDRNFLGWHGRFFLHDVAHFHVIHHFFPKIPWYHGEVATQHIKAILGDHYHYSDKAVFRALWETYNQCQFVEDEGDIVFYKDRRGRTVRSLPDHENQ